MQTKVLFFLWAASFPLGFHVNGEGMSVKDRSRLVAHLDMTESWLLDEVDGLSEQQLHFRNAPDRWTIAEVVQHLVIAEPTYWDLFRKGMDAAVAQPLHDGATDADVLWYGIDRSHRQKTEASKNALGQKIDLEASLAKFRKLHTMMADYAKSTQEDLRHHSVPDWQVDAYQCLLEISTHTQRHILQIREIKSDAKFPRQQPAKERKTA